MTATVFLELALAWLCLALLAISSEALSCYQCNVYDGMSSNEVCEVKPAIKHDCMACLKTFTRVYMHNQWMSYQYLSVTSKFCVRRRGIKYSEGCVSVVGSSSYSKRCFCFSHLCNASQNPRNYHVTTLLLTVASGISLQSRYI